MTHPASWRARLARVWPVAKYLLGLGLAALVFDQLTDEKGELAAATIALSQLRWGWLPLAVAAEAGSLLAYAMLQQRLLRAGRVEVATGPMTAITLAANSITNSLPAGPAFATVFSFRQFRWRGADEAVAGWSVAATFVVASVTLAVLAATGAAVAGAEGASLDLVGVIVAVLLLTLGIGAVFVQKRALAWTVSALLRLCQRLTGRPRGEVAAHIDRIILRLTAVRLSPGQLARVLCWGLTNWTLDCGCLIMAFLAVGAGVPWKGLLLAYGAGQLAANLPITPGGLGVVEGSLTIAIVAYGSPEASTVAAVLLYRIVSFWLPLPVGWGAWAWLTWTGRRRPRVVPVLADRAGPDPAGSSVVTAEGLPGGREDASRAVRVRAWSAGLRSPPQSTGPLPRRGQPDRRLRAHRRSRRRGLQRPAALLASVAVTAAGLAGCGAGRDALGTNAGPCFAALPVARHAVHDRGKLAGVRLVSTSTLTARDERIMRKLLDLLPIPPARDVCLVAYAGNFASGQVERPAGPPPPAGAGRYAVAVVTTPKPRLLATFLLRHEPLDFSRPRVGF